MPGHTEPTKFSSFRKLLSFVRIFAFYGILISALLVTFPQLKETIFSSQIYLWLILGGIVLALFFAVLLFFPTLSNHNDETQSVFDTEAVVIVVSGMVVFLIAGVISLLVFNAPHSLVLGFVLMGIYSFYIYRIVRDAVRIREENEDVRKQYGRLLEIDKEKTNFITVTSHQLRTPLTEIRWSLEAVLGQKLETNTAKVLRDSLAGISRLINIVNDMLAAGTINSRSPENSVLLGVLLDNIVEGLEELRKKKDVKITLTPASEPIAVEAEEDKLKTALQNIVDNAIRYSPKGTVNISIAAEGKKASIKIQDTGVGIAQEEYERVFRKFFRGKNALLLEPDGSGMGLYTAATIIRKLGGTINFVSQLDKGTIFLISLPRILSGK